MTTDLYVRVIFLLKSILGAHFVNFQIMGGKNEYKFGMCIFLLFSR